MIWDFFFFKSTAHVQSTEPQSAVLKAGSSFCTDAEQGYAPVEGEAMAISWALEKCRMFILGCPNVIVVTDHEQLKGLFGKVKFTTHAYSGSKKKA